MADFLTGELLLPPAHVRGLTWPELDCLQAGQHARRQRDMVGFRLVATQVYNALAEKPLSEREYLPLPAVDGTAPLGGSVDQSWLARKKQEYLNKPTP